MEFLNWVDQHQWLTLALTFIIFASIGYGLGRRR